MSGRVLWFTSVLQPVLVLLGRGLVGRPFDPGTVVGLWVCEGTVHGVRRDVSGSPVGGGFCWWDK